MRIYKAQAGICAEPSLHTWVLLFDITTDEPQRVREKLRGFPKLAEDLAERFSEAYLSSILSIGATYWDILSATKPRELNHQPYSPELLEALPVQGIDLVMIIHSDRADANFFVAQTLQAWFASVAELYDLWQGLRYLDGRSLFGFKAPLYPMPHGSERRDWALLPEKNNREFGAGSYLWLQKNNLDINSWNQLSTEAQRTVMGCEKVSGQVLEQATSATTSSESTGAETAEIRTHYHSTAVGHEPVGSEMRVWREQAPIINLQAPTEMLLHWSHSCKDIERSLLARYRKRMLKITQPKTTEEDKIQAVDLVEPNEAHSQDSPAVSELKEVFADPLLDYEMPDALYILFAPSLNWLEAL